MSFDKFAKSVHQQLSVMSTGRLFEVDIDGNKLYEEYLAAFPEGTNPIFRERTEHDCNCCKYFIRRAGKLVAIKQGKILTVWDNYKDLPHPYNVVGERMYQLVKDRDINSLFVTKHPVVSQEKSVVQFPEFSETFTFKHFYFKFEGCHVSNTPERVSGAYNTNAQMLARAVEELSIDAIDQVIDLIGENSIYRGQEHLALIKEFRKIKVKYDKLKTEKAKNIFAWDNASNGASRFRNTVIGTLIVDLSEGVGLEDAVRSFESKVAPANYKRPKALITKAMVNEATKTLKELNLSESIHRRMAKPEDVSVRDVIYADQSVMDVMKDNDDLMNLLGDQVSKPSGRKVTAKNKGVDITIEEFIEKVVPNAKQIDLLVENDLTANLMTVTAPIENNAEPLFKWGNNFAWSYRGNTTDAVKERVKAAGGNTDAQLRVSLSWYNYDDLDLHCDCPDGRIYFGNKKGILDVDMNAGGRQSREAVENMAWNNPKNGTYVVTVDNYSKRENIDKGFQLQVQVGDEITNYHYPHGVNNVKALQIEYKDGSAKITVLNNRINSESLATTQWGITTKDFHKVNMMMLSPNHWDNSDATGNKHYFFILEGCENDEPCRGLYNEYLRPDLTQHRKVFEVLGDKTKCKPEAGQLSGIGVSSTMKKTVRLRVQGDGSKLYNVSF